MSLISVCVPTFDRPNMVKRAIESVLSQDFQDYELLVHDNSENTSTRDVVLSFKDDRIRYLQHKKNIGLVGNWNSLIEEATGQYLKYLNDDDWIEKGCLTRFSEALRLYPGVGVVTCRAQYVSETGEVFKEDRITGNGQSYYVRPHDIAFMWLNQALPVRTPTHSMYRRDVTQAFGGFDDEYSYARDVYLSINIASKNGAYFIEDKPYVSFVKHHGQDVFAISTFTRINDQHEINCKVSAMGGEIGVDVEVINSSISLRELVILMRARNFVGAVEAFYNWLYRKRRIRSIKHFFMKNILVKFSLAQLDSKRIYK